MIAHLKGTVSHIEDEFLVLDVGGVGYQVFYAVIPELEIGKELKIYTVYHGGSQHDNTVTLYGFNTAQEVTLMRTIQGKVSGVGAKAAMLIMRTLTPSQIADAVMNERPDVFKTVPGIGKKTAERIVLELRDIMSKLPVVPGQLPASGAIDDARAALRALGFTIGEVEKALNGIDRELSSEDIIRHALEKLG